MDWDDLRFFLALAETGTHSAAAKRLNVAQPTVGRRIRRLETALGVLLFERAAECYVLSVAGEALLRRARSIGVEIGNVTDALRAFQDQAAGVVRVSAPDWVVSRVLVRMLPEFVEQYPGVKVELIADPALVNLPARGADIALRVRRFELPGTWQRAVGRAEFGIFASRKYVKRRGHTLSSPAAGHRLVSMDDRAGPIADVEWLKKVAAAAQVVACANGRDVLSQLVREGCGFGCLPNLVARDEPQLVRLEGLGVPPARRLWLGVHQDQRALPRIRRVYEAIVEVLRAELN